MARRPSAHPTDAELDILKVLWESGPSELGPIVQGVNRERPVASTTVATTLKVMVEKGLVERASGPRGYRWSARVSRRKASAGLLQRLVDRVFDGSAGRLVARLVEDGALDARERAEIVALLNASEPPEERRRAKKGEKP